MPPFCTAALLVVAAVAGPIGTLVCRLQCVGTAVVAVRTAGACGHGGSPDFALSADAAPCDERVGPAALKPERFEPSSPVAFAALNTLREPRRRARPTIILAPLRPLAPLAFLGTDLPLRI